MLRRILVFSVLLSSLKTFSQHTVQFIISSLSLNSSDSNFFIAGSFNGWNPGGKSYHFQKNTEGNYFLETSLADGNYEFKITRGSWDKVECRPDGTDIQNRVLKIERDTMISIIIQGWKDNLKLNPK